MDHRARGNVRDGERVAGENVGAVSRDHGLADGQTVRAEDVGLLAVRVVQKGETRRAVGIVFDRRDLRGDPVLAALEVDDAVAALMTAAPEPHGETTAGVAAARLAKGLCERFLGPRLGDLLERGSRHDAAAGGVCGVGLESHWSFFS